MDRPHPTLIVPSQPFLLSCIVRQTNTFNPTKHSFQPQSSPLTPTEQKHGQEIRFCTEAAG